MIGRKSAIYASDEVDPGHRLVEDLAGVYGLRIRVVYAVAASILGILIAGFWNFKLVDGFGRHIIAANTIGDTHAMARTFESNGIAFGLVFAVVAGLAATFTACNCVVFAMLPSLTCDADASAPKLTLLRTFAPFVAGVVAVGGLYGALIGGIGAEGAAKLNGMRLLQAQIVFTGLGILLLVWGAIEFGFLRRLTAQARFTFPRQLSAPLARAAIMGIMVGFFAVGRPFPVFRDLLTYAASSNKPLYGALVMGIQGLGQVTVMLGLLLLIVRGPGRRLISNWMANKPAQAALITGTAFVIGGSYLVYYWGISILFGVGQWGFKLGLYS